MEEIIIDGVNVWSCKHYDLENNYCDQSYLGEGGLLKNTKNPKRCECSPNCYYKQLKRLEQENAELKETIKKYSKINEQETKDYAELLKETNKYHKALEEIKEIAKFNQFYNPEKLLINGDIGQIQNLKMTEIYNKINEVLDE